MIRSNETKYFRLFCSNLSTNSNNLIVQRKEMQSHFSSAAHYTPISQIHCAFAILFKMIDAITIYVYWTVHHCDG